MAAPLSLYHLLDPDVLADPYPLYRRLRTESPVHWDPYLHAWIVTRYADVVTVLHRFSAARTPTPEQLAALGLESLTPIAAVMVRQMLFLDAPAHTRIRGLASPAFTPRRVEHLRAHIQEITDSLLDAVTERGRLEVIEELAAPLPAIVTAEMLGVPIADHPRLKAWSADFAEMLGNFQHNPDRAARVLRSTEDMLAYFRAAVREQQARPQEGLVGALLRAEVDGDRFSEDEVIANCIVTMVGGQETTTNLIGNGVLSLLRHPDQLERLRAEPGLIAPAVEELLRYESPSQHTARLAPEDVVLGDKLIRRRQAVDRRDGLRQPRSRALSRPRSARPRSRRQPSPGLRMGRPLLLRGAPGPPRGADRPLHAAAAAPRPAPGAGAVDLARQPRPARAHGAAGGLRAESHRRRVMTRDPRDHLEPLTSSSPHPHLLRNGRAPAPTARSLSATPRGGAALGAVGSPPGKTDGATVARPGHIVARRDAGPIAPVSFAQQQLWLHAHLEPDTPVYNEPVTIHHTGPLDVLALERALAEILRRHEAWRTTFTVVEGELRQVVHPPSELALPVVDLRRLPAAARESEALRIATEEALRPFNLEQGPLLRATLVQLDDLEHRLFLTLHHIIFDGVALYRVFLPELAAIYDAFVSGCASPLAEPPIQYADFAAWQREGQAGSQTWSRQLAYWRQALAGAPVLDLPTDRPRPALQTFRGAMERLAFSRACTDAVKALGARERASLYMTMLTAFTALLHRYAGQAELVVGTVTAGRKHREVESLLGYFLNPLALRLDCSGDPTFRELLARVRGVTLDALSNDDVPFEQVVNEVQPQRDRDRNPLFQVMFSLEPPLPPLPPAWRLTQLDVETGTAKFDLYLELDDRPEGMIGRFLYRTDLFEPATIARMAGHFRSLVDAIVADPDRRLSALPLLTPAERQQLLVEWNDTTTPYPSDSTVHQVFEARAAQAPDAIALVHGDEQVTYGELNARANRVAHRLRALGVGPDAVVGVCLERSPDLVVAFLGILKAGGAYVPLDPLDPPDRLAFMLADAGAAAVLTHRTHLDGLPRGECLAICLDADRRRSAPRAT